MNIHFREAKIEDKDFILQANKEINKLSNLFDSTLDDNIEKDIFENKVANVLQKKMKIELVLLYTPIFTGQIAEKAFICRKCM